MPRTTLVALLALLAGATLAGDLSAAPGTKQQLRDKQAQAHSVLAQVNQLDARFGATVEAWDGAKYELGLTQKELKADRATLKRAEKQRRVAVARVEARLVALYESDSDSSTVGILFGSSNLSEVLNRLDAVHAVAAEDHALAAQATAARNRYAAAEQKAQSLEKQRAADVAQLAGQRQKIGSMLAERRRLLASVQGEVTKLQAQEVREQAILAAQAKERLAEEQRAAAARAATAAAAAKAAAAAAATKPAVATTTAPSTASTPPSDPTTTVSVPTVTPPSSGLLPAGHPEAATIALKYLGIPYQWGGADPATGFDCSGLVMYVYAQLGIQLPHYAAAQFGFGTAVPRDELQPGDLVFFDKLGHVGIYIGGGDMVHAPETGDVVKIEAISDFGNNYVGARRL
ncbi:MAG TPA: NlpC/P60 family protein [Gaiellaceae bacterium]|nr:NlpC/P60 family protein [Gaiellaceae bacterium]